MKNILYTIFLLFLSNLSHAQSKHELFIELIQIINENDGYEEFVNQRVGKSLQEFNPISLLKDIHKDLGTLKFIETNYDFRNKYAATIVADENERHGFIINTKTEDGVLKLIGYSITELGNMKDYHQQDFVRFAQKIINDAIEKDKFSGNIFISQHGKTLVDMNIGYASKELGVKNNDQTRFDTGSITKMLTSLAIHILATRGLIDLEDPIIEYIPELEDTKINQNVKILDLLSHESGLGDIIFDSHTLLMSKWKFNNYHDFLPLIYAKEEFGEYGVFEYSNSGYLLLGKLIENVTGKTYDNFVQDEILDRLDMRNTQARNQTELIQNSANGYSKIVGDFEGGQISFERDSESNWMRYNKFDYGFSTPAGGYYSTEGDLVKLLNGLVNKKLVSENLGDMMMLRKNFFPSFQYRKAKGYGLGVTVHQHGKYESIGHAGTAPGWSSELHYIKELDLLIVIMSNYDRMEGAQNLFRTMMNYFSE